MMSFRTVASFFALSMLAGCQKKADVVPTPTASPLKIAYSDWPGWTAFEIAIQKGWFKEAGVEVAFSWFEYAPSMEAFAAGKVDAVTVASGDALVTGAQGGKNVAILVTDYSNGNDMIVAKPGIKDLADLKGKTIGLELGLVEHLLLQKGLASKGLKIGDVKLTGVATSQTAQVLASGSVDAIGAWQPNSGQALKSVPGSKSVYSSADAPGLIYDFLAVNPQSLATRRDDWVKVVKIWNHVVSYLRDPATRDSGIAIMAARVGVPAADYAKFIDGTKLLTLEESRPRFQDGATLEHLGFSMAYADTFNVANKVYAQPQAIASYLDSSLTVDALKP